MNKTIIICALMFTITSFAFAVNASDNYTLRLQSNIPVLKSDNQTVKYHLSVLPDFSSVDSVNMACGDYFCITHLNLKTKVVVEQTYKKASHGRKNWEHSAKLKQISLKDLLDQKTIKFSDEVGNDLVLSSEEGKDEEGNDSITVNLTVNESANPKLKEEDL